MVNLSDGWVGFVTSLFLPKHAFRSQSDFATVEVGHDCENMSLIPHSRSDVLIFLMESFRFLGNGKLSVQTTDKTPCMNKSITSLEVSVVRVHSMNV